MSRIASAVVFLSAVTLIGHAQSPARDTAQPQTGNGIIRGRVLAAGTDAPLRNARVRVTSSIGAVPVALTDADGRFVVPSLVAGAYGVSVSKAGYVTSSGRSITVGPGAVVENVDVGLAKAAVISGQILDSFGEPVIGMTVTAERPATAGSLQTVVVATTQTDDLGNYRLGGLPQGSFFVAGAMREFIIPARVIIGPNNTASLGDMIVGDGKFDMFAGTRSGLASPPQRTYYPGAPIVEQAQPIALGPGEERSSIDLIVPALQMQTVPSVARALFPGARIFVRDGVTTIDAGSGRPLGPDCPSEPLCRGAIRGRVTRADGGPLRQAFVLLQVDGSQDQPPMVLTDDAGRYEFNRLPAGTFRVAAQKPGFMTLQFGQSRPLSAGEPIDVQTNAIRDRIDIIMPRTGAITGRVVDDAGEPVEGVDVGVLRIGYESGRRRLSSVGTRRTDDAGNYRVYGLQPGEYAVRADAGVPGSATTYFPGTVNPKDVQLIPMGFSQDAGGVDFALSGAPTTRISGTALDAMGRPVRGSVTLRNSRRSGSLDAIDLGADLRADGTFEFLRVPPGEYVIQADTDPSSRRSEGARPPQGQVDEFASAFVTVAGTDVTGVSIRTSAGSTAAGRITLDGPADEFFYNEIDLMAVSVDADLSLSRRTSYMGIAPDLTVGIGGLTGPRVFRLTRAPEGWALKAVLLNGVDITDIPLNFGATDQSVSDLEIALTRRVSEVSGRVTDARGRGVRDATVVVFTGDRQSWGPASRFVATTKTGRDGTFSIRGLPPADYFVAAVDSAADGEWQAPEFLDAVFPDATRATLFEGDKLSVTLTLIAR